MTVGITGVVWLPRTAMVNSTTLWAGAGPAPATVASTAWGAIAAAFTDATATLVRVGAVLIPAWQGVAGAAVLARLAAFGQWTDQVAVAAGVMSTESGAHASAVTAARLVMPSIPEIAAVQAAKAAAYSSGGVVTGTAEVAEAIDRAMDIRAAIVMEAYEAATTVVVSAPVEFVPPPPIASPAAGAAAADSERGMSPVDLAAAGAAAMAHDPSATLAANVLSQAGGTAASSVAPVAAQLASAGLGDDTGRGSGSMAAPLASGIGAGASVGPRTTHLASTPPPSERAPISRADAPAAGSKPSSITVRPSTATAAGAAMYPPLSPLGAGRGGDSPTRASPVYLRGSYLADGRTIAPATIGAEPIEVLPIESTPVAATIGPAVVT